MSKTFILGFNYDEAKEYMRKNLKDLMNPEDSMNPGNYYIILNRIEQLQGTINPDVRILPNAYRREDYNEFIDYIRTRQR